MLNFHAEFPFEVLTPTHSLLLNLEIPNVAKDTTTWGEGRASLDPAHVLEEEEIVRMTTIQGSPILKVKPTMNIPMKELPTRALYNVQVKVTRMLEKPQDQGEKAIEEQLKKPTKEQIKKPQKFLHKMQP